MIKARLRTLVKRLVWAPLVFSALTGATASAQVVSPYKRLVPKTDEPKLDSELTRTLGALRGAFLSRDADQLARALADKKIFLSLRAAETGYYTRSQIRFIFQKMFREMRTQSFGYAREDVAVSDEGRAFVRTDWTYTATGAETPVTERLLFAFEKEQASWNVSEIKAAPR